MSGFKGVLSDVLVFAVTSTILFLGYHLIEWFLNYRSEKKEGIKKIRIKLSAAHYILFVFIIISKIFQKIISLLSRFFRKFGQKIWSSRFRWVWIVLISIYVSYYGIKGYNRFFTEEVPSLKPTSTMITDKLVFVFNPPPGAEPPYRAEIVDHFLVETAKNDRVVFDFGRGAMKVYTIEGQKTIYRGLSKATRQMSGIPFHSEESLEGPVYKGHKIDKISPPGIGFIVGGTEIEWPELPCVLKVSTLKGNPMKLKTDKVKFRFVPQNTLGSVPKK